MTNLSVTFFLVAPDGHYVPEGQLESNFKAYRGGLAGADRPSGGVTIEDSLTGSRTEIGDMLESAVLQLCLMSVPDLAAGKSFDIDLMRHIEQINLTFENGRVKIAGEETSPEWYPRDQLLPALVACAERYLAFLEKLGDERPDVLELVRTVRAQVARAKAALE